MTQKIVTHLNYSILFIKILFFSIYTHANTVTLSGVQKITTPTTYANDTLILKNASFYISQNASLAIENSTIEATLSPENPHIFSIFNASLILKNNTVNLSTENIPPTPNTSPKYSAILLHDGHITLNENSFNAKTPYTIGLMMTSTEPTSLLTIKKNKIYNFHGGILVVNSSYDDFSENTFTNVSNANIYLKNTHDIIAEKNTILFSGNNNVGDSFDIIDSKGVRLSSNLIYSSSCYSIFILRSQDILLNDNIISNGITYAIFATNDISPYLLNKNYLKSLDAFFNEKQNLQKNSNITILNNYLSQNRFGLAAQHVNGLLVKNNIFVQHFKDNKSRQFWTNNDILLKENINVIWMNNLYKEAFSQDIFGNNESSNQFILFPEHNGILF